MALFSADDITYPPLDVPKPVADGVWIVDSGPLRVFGLLGLPIRMTALQLSSGDMLMHSPTRFDARLKAEIEAHGPIRHLVAPNIAHWSFQFRKIMMFVEPLTAVPYLAGLDLCDAGLGIAKFRDARIDWYNRREKRC